MELYKGLSMNHARNINSPSQFQQIVFECSCRSMDLLGYSRMRGDVSKEGSLLVVAKTPMRRGKKAKQTRLQFRCECFKEMCGVE